MDFVSGTDLISYVTKVHIQIPKSARYYNRNARKSIYHLLEKWNRGGGRGDPTFLRIMDKKSGVLYLSHKSSYIFPMDSYTKCIVCDIYGEKSGNFLNPSKFKTAAPTLLR